MRSAPLLSVRDLVVTFQGADGPVAVIDGVSFDLDQGEVLGIVGESGSGKSVTLLAVLGLLPPGRGWISGGSITFDGQRIDTANETALRRLRGGAIGMIFQDPMTSLNPVLRVGGQIGETVRIHQPHLSGRAVKARVHELLEIVGVPDPAERARQFPHEFSGGMRQRAMIALAIANEPRLLIADEPTTALDVTIQAQVMDVLQEVRTRTGSSMILVTHDLGLVAETADRIAVMYSGRIVEAAPTEALFDATAHPYTRGLLASLPRLDGPIGDLTPIPGQPPDVSARPPGCAFAPRCGQANAQAGCMARLPDLVPIGPDHRSACLLHPASGGTA